MNHWEGEGGTVLEGKYLHMICAAHILNLAMKDGLTEVNKSILRICTAVKYVRSSPARLSLFKACVLEEGMESKALVCLDVDT